MVTALSLVRRLYRSPELDLLTALGVSSQTQLEQNLKDFEKGPLPEEVVKALDDAWIVTKGTTPNYWHLDMKYTYDTKDALFKPGKK